MSDTVQYSRDGHIATIRLNRPEMRNAMDFDMSKAFDEAVDKAINDTEAWVVVVVGNGKSFCAGVDIKLLVPAASNNTDAKFKEPMNRSGHIGWSAYKLWTLEKPTISAIRGHAFGGGMGIALACDIRVAAEDAQFSAIFTQRGLAPDSGTSFFLMQSVGYSKACELAFTARRVDAREAERLGMVNKVVAVERVEEEAMALAREIATGAPVAVRMAKRVLRRGLDAEALGSVEYELYVNNLCSRTEDLAEGGKAFLEKRPPRWKGR
ncbi:MAG: enoyl-CoA hydratase/isomerase family protein [Chloroflexi bacterium]|nr:enoyl-CoA hydratase/isomerase family protein [Chloroflexota bacterium]